MAGQDYGPRGCCGPAAFAMLAVIVATVVGLIGLLS